MGIKTFVKDGTVQFEVRVCARAKGDREVSRHRTSRGVLEGVTPEQLEAGLPEDARKRLQRIEMQLFGDARAEIALIVDAGLTWERLLERFEKEALFDSGVMEFLGLGSRSAHGYRQALRDHTDVWNKMPASEITSADFELLVFAMRKTGYAASTIYNLKSAINCCFKWAIKKRVISKVTVSPTFGCTISRKSARRPEILNFTQICKLLDCAEATKHEWYPIWKFVLHTGFRSGEVHALKRQDLCREEKRIMLDTKYNFESRVEEDLKDHEWRQVPINEELDQFFEEKGIWDLKPAEYVFPRIKQWKYGKAAEILREFCESIGVPSVCFHTLRACWATQLLRNNVPQVKVMMMGGWADLETMQAYLRRSGIEIEGATDSLKFNRKERPGRVFKLVSGAAREESFEEDGDSV